MLVYIVITSEGRKEQREIMLPSKSIIGPAGNPIPEINQDMILGVYWSTIEHQNQKLTRSERRFIPYKGVYTNVEELEKHMDMGIVHPHDYVAYDHTFKDGTYKTYVDTAGRIVFNSIIPQDHGFTAWREWVLPDNQEIKMFPEFGNLADAKSCGSSGDLDIDESFVHTVDGKYYVQTLRKSDEGPGVEVTPVNSVYSVLTSSPKFGTEEFPAPVTKSSMDTIVKVAQRCGQEYLAEFLNRMKNFAFKMAAESGVTISIFDFVPLLRNAELQKTKAEVEKAVNEAEVYMSWALRRRRSILT